MNSDGDLKNEVVIFDACVRNLEIIGEASHKIPNEIKKAYPQVPWREIKGMRNILAHEYFGVSTPIIWKTIKTRLPALKSDIESIIKKYEYPNHPWRVCPVGEYYVSGSEVDAHPRLNHFVKEHPRRSHCRQSKNLTANVLNGSEIKLIGQDFILPKFKDTVLKDYGFKKLDHKYDAVIAGWTQFWNDVFNPKLKLDPNFVKALIASESGFDPDPYKGNKKKAMGIGQLMPTTVKSLQGFKNELRDNLFEFNDNDVFDPEINIAALIRWLHQKQFLASKKLKRDASWVEAVENYKGQMGKNKTSDTYKRYMGKFLNYIDAK